VCTTMQESQLIITPLRLKSSVRPMGKIFLQHYHFTCIRTQTRWPNLCPEEVANLQYDMYRPGISGAVKSTAMSSSFSVGTPS